MTVLSGKFIATPTLFDNALIALTCLKIIFNQALCENNHQNYI
jgi:hypothetical protein